MRYCADEDSFWHQKLILSMFTVQFYEGHQISFRMLRIWKNIIYLLCKFKNPVLWDRRFLRCWILEIILTCRPLSIVYKVECLEVNSAPMPVVLIARPRPQENFSSTNLTDKIPNCLSFTVVTFQHFNEKTVTICPSLRLTPFEKCPPFKVVSNLA